MPIMRCQRNGKQGFKYGPTGHCYTGPNVRQRAARQGAAIEANRSRSRKSK